MHDPLDKQLYMTKETNTVAIHLHTCIYGYLHPDSTYIPPKELYMYILGSVLVMTYVQTVVYLTMVVELY